MHNSRQERDKDREREKKKKTEKRVSFLWSEPQRPREDGYFAAAMHYVGGGGTSGGHIPWGGFDFGPHLV